MFKSQMEAPQLRTVVAVVPDWSSSSENRELGCLGTSHHTLGAVGSLRPSHGTQKGEGGEWTDSPLLHLGVYLLYTLGVYWVFFKGFIYLFLERGEGRVKERETNTNSRETSISCHLHAPNLGLARKPGMRPDPEWDLRPFGLQDNAQPTEHTSQGGCLLFFEGH